MKTCLAAILLMTACLAAHPAICPKGVAPARTLYVADVGSLPADEQLFFSSLQGITAQLQPRIYLVRDAKEDGFWLDWIIGKNYVGQARRVDPWDLPAIFGSEIRDAVIWDRDLPATVNIATMLSGVYRLAVCTPEIAEKVGIDARYDLRGRWTSNADAYEWALENLRHRLNDRIVCSLHPFAAQHRIRDYLIQHRVFTFWIAGRDDSDRRGASDRDTDVIRAALATWPHNIPIIGFWYAGETAPGISEYGGLMLGGESGKFTVCHDWATNTSVHSGIRVRPEVFVQKRAPAPVLDRSKVYVAVTQFESGDAPWYWQRPQLSNWQDGARGSFPMGWCVGPATLDLLPAVLQWYYEHASDSDYFFCAMSGAGYIMTPHFATGVADPDRTWRDFVRLTGECMKRLDLDIVSLHNDAWHAPVQYAESPILRRYAEGIPGLRAILCDFGRMEHLDIDRANHYTCGGVPVFHTLNRWLIEGDPAEYLARQITEAAPRRRPAFVSVMALSWTYTPSMITSAIDRLGADYVFVTPEQMAELYSRYCPRQGAHNSYETDERDTWVRVKDQPRRSGGGHP